MSREKKLIASAFMDMAKGLEGGSYGKSPRIAVTGLGSEHGESNVMEGALMAAERGVEVCYIGTITAPGVDSVYAQTEAQCHEIMEELLKSGRVQGALTMHYPFPIGVSTVGRVLTPAKGRSMFIAATTGTAGGDRTETIIKNALHGVIAAKACGVLRPSVGLLNLDGARQAELALRELKRGGYDIALGESARPEGGPIMRGNDVLLGSVDVMVTDSLTGNVIMKLLSAFTTGGSLESAGWGYGPGIGRGMDKLVLIVSRASGAAVVANGLEYAARLARGNVMKVAAAELAGAERAGLGSILSSRRGTAQASAGPEPPPKETVSQSISGIDVMDIEAAVSCLWGQGIYAEPGMGCTGPIVMVSDRQLENAAAILRQGGFLA